MSHKASNKNDRKSSDRKSSKRRDNSKLTALASCPERKSDSVPFRLEFIKTLLNGKKLEPIVQADSDNETEYYVNPNRYHGGESNESGSLDTKTVLNKKMHNFYTVINQIGGTLTYIKSGSTGHTFRGTVEGSNGGASVDYAVKICAYPNTGGYGEVNDIRRPENAELMMIRLLSYFVIRKQTPHIVLPIGTFNTSIDPFLNLIERDVVEKDNKEYNKFLSRYKKGVYPNTVSVLISEWANKGDFLAFIRSYYREAPPIFWKVIFFQLISTLAVIQSKFPTFRHNDLKANNILVHKIERWSNSYTWYTVVQKRYRVPYIDYRIKLWDFDFACIPGIVENSKVNAEWTNKINVAPEGNKYYDLHYFFNTFIKHGFFPQFMESSCIPKDAKDFVNRIIPPKYQSGELVTKRGRILVDDEYTTPAKILQEDPYFEEFRYSGPRPTRQRKSHSNIDKSNLIKMLQK